MYRAKDRRQMTYLYIVNCSKKENKNKPIIF